MPDRKTYNIGMSGHQLPTCLDNLEAAADEYAPSEYVIIQAGNLDMPSATLSALADGTLAEIPSYDSGVVYYLQKIPAIKAVYKQLREKLSSDWNGMKRNVSESGAVTDTSDDGVMLKQLLAEKSRYCEERGIKLMIAYTPEVEVDGDGKMRRKDCPENTEKFAEACGEANIGFIDCYDAFVKNYDENYEVPFGFDNATMGAGHLNMTGHRILAEQIMDAVGGNR